MSFASFVSPRTWLVLSAFAAVLSGCGSVVVEAEPSSAGGPMPQPKTPPSPTPDTRCAIVDPADPGRPVLALARGADIVLVRADGSSNVAFTFDLLAGESSEFPPQIELAARGDFIAAVGFSNWPATISEAVLLRRSGEVVGRSMMSTDAYLSLYLSAEGWLATAVNVAASTLHIAPSGAPSLAASMWPIGTPRPGGRTPVLLDPRSSEWEGCAWFDPVTNTTTPLAYPTASGHIDTDAGLVYVANAGSTSVFVREDPNGASFLPLPALGGFVIATSRSGWAVVHSSDESFLLAMPSAAALEPIALPSELSPLGGFIDSWYDGPAVEDTGDLLLVSRDPYRGGLHRSSDAGASWELLGTGFSHIDAITFVARAGTYVIRAVSEGGAQTWSDPPSVDHAPGQVGPGIELARPNHGIHRALPSGAAEFVLNQDGLCLAYVEAGVWQATDVTTGFEMAFADALEGQPARAVWLE